MFSRRWPSRSDDYADAINRIPEVAMSPSTPALDSWSNSSLLRADLARTRDMVAVESTSVVHALAPADAVAALGAGDR